MKLLSLASSLVLVSAAAARTITVGSSPQPPFTGSRSCLNGNLLGLQWLPVHYLVSRQTNLKCNMLNVYQAGGKNSREQAQIFADNL